MSRAYNNEFSCIIVYGSKSCMFITQYSIPNFHGYSQHTGKPGLETVVEP